MTTDNLQSTAVESKLVENVMTLIFMLRGGSIAFGIWIHSLLFLKTSTYNIVNHICDSHFDVITYSPLIRAYSQALLFIINASCTKIFLPKIWPGIQPGYELQDLVLITHHL